MIDVKPGWKEGTRITFEEAGVCFQLAQQEHPRFSRRGHDLAAVAFCGLLDLLVRGSSHEVRTLA